MYIGLVPYIKNQFISGKGQAQVQCHCYFHNSEIGCKMTSRTADYFDQAAPYFLCQKCIIGRSDFLNVICRSYLIQSAVYHTDTHPLNRQAIKTLKADTATQAGIIISFFLIILSISASSLCAA